MKSKTKNDTKTKRFCHPEKIETAHSIFTDLDNSTSKRKFIEGAGRLSKYNLSVEPRPAP
jgi:hypothetical protein